MAKSSFDALAEILGALQSLNIPYMLVGSFSSNVYGFPRATKDADIVFQYSDGDLARIKGQLSDDYVLEQQMSFETMTGSVRNVFTFLPTKFDIELYRLSDDAHDQARFSRRRTVSVPSLSIEATIPTAEDVIIQKLRWQREKDVSDARIVLQVQFATLDWAYLQRWAKEHGTAELLEDLRSAAAEG